VIIDSDCIGHCHYTRATKTNIELNQHVRMYTYNRDAQTRLKRNWQKQMRAQSNYEIDSIRKCDRALSMTLMKWYAHGAMSC